MNKERLQQCIDVMSRAESLSMKYWQSIANGRFVISPLNELCHTIEDLHACGNSACFAGYVAISPEFKSVGGSCDEAGAPTFRGKIENAIQRFLEIDQSDIAYVMFYSLITGQGSVKSFGSMQHDGVIYGALPHYVDCAWHDWQPSHVIKILEAIRDRDPQLIESFKAHPEFERLTVMTDFLADVVSAD